MRRTNALQDYLEDTTRRYNDGEHITVEWGSTPHVTYEHGEPVIRVSPNVRKWLGRNISEEQEFRCLLDDLNHEVAHPRRTPQDAKKSFMEEHPECPNLAGQVWNMYEDVYIDHKRTERWKGLRRARAFVIDTVMENSHRHGRVDNIDDSDEQLVEGVFQATQAGYVKGIDNLDDDVQRFLGWCRQQAEQIKQIGGPDERRNIESYRINGDGYYEQRYDLISTVVGQLKQRLNNLDNADEAAQELSMPSGTLPDEDELDFEESEGQQQDDTSEADGDGDGEGDATDNEENGSDEGSDGDGEKDGDMEDGMGTTRGDDDEDDDSNPEEGGGAGIDMDDPSTENGEGPDPTEAFDAEGGSGSLQMGDQQRPDGPTGDDTITAGVSADNDGEDMESDADMHGNQSKRDEATPTGEVPDADDIGAHVDRMKELDEERLSGPWYDVPDDDYDVPQDRFKDRYDDLQRKKARDNTSTAEKIRKRDNLSDGRADRVKQRLRETGLADDIREAFEELITRDEWVPSRRGQRVHKRNAIRRISGDQTVDNLYEHKRRAEIGDRAVAVALDMSGSMNETEAKTALAALQQATSIIGDQFTACGYKTFSPEGTGKQIITTPLITAPREDFDWNHLDAVWASGSTPTPAGIEEASRLLDECTQREDVLIVITDGRPNMTSDGSGTRHGAIEETQNLVRQLRSEGVTVIGLGVGGRISDDQLETMFEGQYVTTKMDNLAQELVSVYREQMDVTDL